MLEYIKKEREIKSGAPFYSVSEVAIYLSYCSVTVMRHHDQGISYIEKHWSGSGGACL